MTVGEMRDRLRFEKRASVPDEYGNTIAGDWTEQFTRQARLRPRFGGETVTAQRLQGVNPVNITVRSDSLTRTITADWRAVDTRTGEAYAITSVVDPDRRNQWVEIEAASGRAE